MLVGSTACFSFQISNDTQYRIKIEIFALKKETPHMPKITFENLLVLEPGEKWEDSQAYAKFSRDAKKLYENKSFSVGVMTQTIPIEKGGDRRMMCMVESEKDNISFFIHKKGKLSCGVNLKNDSAVPSTK